MSAETQRTPERLRHHFEVERELAGKMRNSSRADRTELFKTLYNELFERVPDHPRLTRRDTPESSRRKVQSQLRLLKPFLKPDTVFLEFAPGDCRLASAVASEVKSVIGVDISDQRAQNEASRPISSWSSMTDTNSPCLTTPPTLFSAISSSNTCIQTT